MTVGVARKCPPFSLGFDCLARVPPNVARMAKAAGMVWCGRYLDGPSPLTAGERDDLFAAGLGIIPLTVAVTSTPLSAQLGVARASFAVAAAKKLGAPPGISIVKDYEAPAASSDALADISAASSTVTGAGFESLLYVGVPEDLGGHALYLLPPHGYWKGGGSVPEPDCGWMILQLEPLDQTMFGGQRVDIDVVKQDFKGRLPTMWWAR